MWYEWNQRQVLLSIDWPDQAFAVPSQTKRLSRASESTRIMHRWMIATMATREKSVRGRKRAMYKL